MAAEQTRRHARKSGVQRRSHSAPRSNLDGGVREGRSILGLQRTRLLSAAVGVLADDGYAGLSAAAVCERAGVSRRTFYEVFENTQACLAAVLLEAERRAREAIAGLDLAGACWDERVRMGLWALLCLADSDPALAKVCLVESQRAGEHVRRERERIVSGLVDVLDEGRLARSGASATSRLTAEALVGAVSSVIAARLEQAPQRCEGGAEVRGLLGELSAMIVLSYLGPAAASRQARRKLPAAIVEAGVRRAGVEDVDALVRVPIRLTYRTARVLNAIAELADGEAGASNREIAERAGISDAGQISKLLGRLQERDLLENAAAPDSHARGEANQWRLTPLGRRFVQSITVGALQHGAASRSAA